LSCQSLVLKFTFCHYLRSYPLLLPSRFHLDVRDESSKGLFRNHTESIIPIDERVIFLSILIIRPSGASPGGAFATTQAFSISLPFVANFKEYILAVNDPSLCPLSSSQSRKPPSLPLEKSIHEKAQRQSQTANIVKASVLPKLY
jgi:hypothetical protein